MKELPMSKIDVAALITALGGRESLQHLLGVGPSAVSNYLTKGALPNRARPLICQALQERGYQIDPQSLRITALPAVKSGRPQARERQGAAILLIVGGGIAAYKALEVSRRLQDHGITVTGVMTKAAQQFITPLSLSALTAQKTYTDLFSLTDEAEMGHIRLARETDLVVVVPATANLMARAAQGLADDLATTLLLATTAPVIMAPAMNPAMWSHAATQANLATLRQRGVEMIGPVAGDTACGEEGEGRMSGPETIVTAAVARLAQTVGAGDLAGRHALVTSGPTVEPLDAVRFISNHSSGRQGHAIAAALAKRGARVTLVSGPVNIPDPLGVAMVHVGTAEQMLAACEAALPADIAICTAAVADWRARDRVKGKIKKRRGDTAAPTLSLTQNPDILAQLSSHSQRPELVIGFAAETDDLQANAGEKLQRKGCDWILANAVSPDGSDQTVFGNAQNKVLLMTGDGQEEWPMMPKTELADRLVQRIIDTIGAVNAKS
jgi:phosphopantothenoylcysteine decarboxylase/phosphopantothenate--cysteine ligase